MKIVNKETTLTYGQYTTLYCDPSIVNQKYTDLKKLKKNDIYCLAITFLEIIMFPN